MGKRWQGNIYFFLSLDNFFLTLLTFRMWLFESKLNATKQFDYHVKNKASKISLKYTFLTLNYCFKYFIT